MRLVSGGVFILLLSSASHAARVATVESDTAKVFETPNSSAKVVAEVKKKSQIAASNLPTEGFYKVRTAAGVIGWVAEEDLALSAPPPPDEEDQPKMEVQKQEEGKPTQISVKKPPDIIRQHVRIRLLGSYNIYGASGVINGVSSLGPGFGFGGELDVHITQGFALIARYEQILQSVNLTDSTTAKVFSVSLNSSPLMGGVDFSIVGQKFSVHFSALGGVTLNTSLSSTSVADANTFTSTASALALLGKVNLDWQFVRFMSLFIEAGYRYLVSSPMSTTGGGVGAIILQPTYSLNLSGPVVGGGISFVF